MDRSSGILLPIFSLPSKYGIGTLGKQAYRFVDFLVKAKQSYWQILPIGQTSYGDSPYQSFSSFAGNPYFIDLDLLVEDNLITKKDIKNLKNDKYIDYKYLFDTRYEVLYKAYLNGKEKYKNEFSDFININNKWLEDYALFISLKKYFDNKSWINWNDDVKKRNNDAIIKYKELLKDDILFYEFTQFLFYKQYYNLKKYANDLGIKIIGDMPIYVALDSCDVWSNSDEFYLDKNTLLPKEVAGVPPDYFSEEGQLWGNPLYDWQHMKSNGYKWWIERIDGISKCFDVVRIDHFRGFEQYWSVPHDSSTAKNGKWNKGPSLDFVLTIKNWFYNVEFIAEDLGIIGEDVVKLIQDCGFPGMRVIEFSIDGKNENVHLPHNYINNTVCYTSTHDNLPINGWLKTLNKNQLKQLKEYYDLNGKDNAITIIKAGMSSVANLFICQMQDYLGFDENTAINRPGTLGNWKYRLDEKDINNTLANKIAYITKLYGR